MADLKQRGQKPLMVGKSITMSMKEVRELVVTLHGELEEKMESLEQKVLLLEGKVAALGGERGLEEEREAVKALRQFRKMVKKSNKDAQVGEAQ